MSRRFQPTLLLVLVALCSCTALRAQAPQPSSPEALYRAAYDAYNAGDLALAHTRFARLVQFAPKVAVGHLAFGEVLLAEGRPQAALAELQAALKLDPGAPATEIALGQAWLALGSADKAAGAFGQAVARGAVLAPEDTLEYVTALAANHHPELAIKVVQDAVSAGAGSLTPAQAAALEDAWGTLLAQAVNQSANQTGSLDEAKQHFVKAMAADPGRASAHAHLGSALLAQHLPDAAVTELREADKLAPSEVAYAIELGRALVATGQDAEAVGVMRRTVALADQQASASGGQVHGEPNGRQPAKSSHDASLAPGPSATIAQARAQARYILALALQATGQPAEALAMLASYAADEPGNPEALTNYALALVQTGDARRAVTLYQQALALGMDTATLREDYGVAYLQQSDLDHAIEQFRAGLKLEPEDPQLHYDLGLAYKLKDNLAEAIPEFEHAEALDPALPDPPYTLGVIHMQQGEFGAATTQLEKAVALQPGNAAAWAVLGNVYKENNEPAKAVESLRHAIQLEHDQPSTHISLAAILAQSGDQPGAAAERKQAAELSRIAVSHQRASFALKSGRALLDQGKLAEAEAQLRTAVAADPQDPAAHQALAEALAGRGQAADAALEREQAARLLAGK